jgi:pyruvate kinase
VEAAAIVCLTTTGKTATLISHFRPKAKIYAVTHSIEPLNRLELVWGLQTFVIKPYQSAEEALAQIEDLLLRYDLIQPSDQIVVTMGLPVAQGAKTNTLRILQVKRTKPKGHVMDLPVRCRDIVGHGNL